MKGLRKSHRNGELATTPRKRRNNKKRSATQTIPNGKIAEIPDEGTYETLKEVEYVESLKIKRSYKYKIVKVRLRFTKTYENIYTRGGYFNNETDMMKAIFDSVMKNDLGSSLLIKHQDQLIGRTNFEAMDSPMDSKVQNDKQVEDFNKLNSDFSERIKDINGNAQETKLGFFRSIDQESFVLA
ncbi:hypothetical protein RhiirC2_788649 [Rhizophagus irregularis]|uniref:Uncharacterized protein n=1 Tax=Rhizophagus irregularis TaxID=588596 RepID=A0A2N1MPQ6_9GLOM|nr:hypothetical protein RhiirC2_788649 [Rhizophagus irregularis]